jgi:hypothetical protein
MCVLSVYFLRSPSRAPYRTPPGGVRQKPEGLPGTPTRVCKCLVGKQNKPTLFKVTEPSSVPVQNSFGVRQKGTYPDPPPVILVQNPSPPRRPMPRLYCPGRLRPEMFPGIGTLPDPDTGSHVVNF